MSEKSCHAQVFRGSLPAIDCCSKENSAHNAVRRAFARVSAWRTPPHWSRRDWLDEARAIIQSAAACAVFDYDVERGVPLQAYIYVRAVAGAWTRYRQEWSYCLHAIECGGSVEPTPTPFDRAQVDETIDYFLGQALGRLTVEDRSLIEQLYWNGTRQDRIAVMLHVTQQEISRRKVRVLRRLRQSLNGCAALLISQLGSLCLTILDALDVIDLIPDVDLLL
jgi:DNA-directed RNA polymerase specialized sigma24 family protein